MKVRIAAILELDNSNPLVIKDLMFMKVDNDINMYD
jgi:hypothetical protein